MTDPGATQAAAQAEWSEERRADLATTLARYLTEYHLNWLVDGVLGKAGIKALSNSVGDTAAYARNAVALFHANGAISKAVAYLMGAASANRSLIADLTYIQNGERLANTQNYQAFRAEIDPFLAAADEYRMLPRMMGSVCAIGIGDTVEEIKGSGFLVGPDLVITNWHVIESVAKMVNGKPEQGTGGEEIYCIFDHDEGDALPGIPLPEGYKSGLVVKGARPTWLVHGRRNLAGDGSDAPEPMIDQLDYAVIKLERPIGNLRAAVGGGERRGWVSLPKSELNYFVQRHLVLFQYPQKRRLQVAHGSLLNLALGNDTRVWYDLHSAYGSSGGAAVDAHGRVYVLHNATVTRADAPKPPARPWNQGVRIDRIAEDIRKSAPEYFVTEPGWGAAPEPPTPVAAAGPAVIVPPPAMGSTPAVTAPTPAVEQRESPDYWSLNDQRYDPRPILGRRDFMNHVVQMSAPGGKRVLVVTGPQDSGVRYSIKLLQRVAPHVGTARFDPSALAKLKPEQFALSLARQLGLVGLNTDALPTKGDNETLPRWISGRLSDWIVRRLVATAALRPGQFPAWVIVNSVVPQTQSLQFGEGIKDLIAELVGVADGSKPPRDIPELRWLFLGSVPDGVQTSVDRRADDNLAGQTAFDKELLHCLVLAWESLGVDEPVSPADAATIAQFSLDQRPEDAPRKVLADKIRELVLDKIQ